MLFCHGWRSENNYLAGSLLSPFCGFPKQTQDLYDKGLSSLSHLTISITDLMLSSLSFLTSPLVPELTLQIRLACRSLLPAPLLGALEWRQALRAESLPSSHFSPHSYRTPSPQRSLRNSALGKDNSPCSLMVTHPKLPNGSAFEHSPLNAIFHRHSQVGGASDSLPNSKAHHTPTLSKGGCEFILLCPSALWSEEMNLC